MSSKPPKTTAAIASAETSAALTAIGAIATPVTDADRAAGRAPLPTEPQILDKIIPPTARSTLKVKRAHPDVQMPQYQTAGAACFDLHVFEPKWREPRRVYGHTPLIVETGLSFEVPEGFVMLIYSRSGHGFKHDVRLANCTGVIDSDYRGPIRVKLAADTDGTAMMVEHGDRVAQALLMPVQQWELVDADALSDTERGEGGYGSTGK